MRFGRRIWIDIRLINQRGVILVNKIRPTNLRSFGSVQGAIRWNSSSSLVVPRSILSSQYSQQTEEGSLARIKLTDGFANKLDQAGMREKDLVKLLELCSELRQSDRPSKQLFNRAYFNLIFLFTHHGLWTQLYSIVNELIEHLDSSRLEQIDLELWNLIIDSFIRLGKSPDSILSKFIHLGYQIDSNIMNSILRASTLESNLSQTLFLLEFIVNHQKDSYSFFKKIDKMILFRVGILLAKNRYTHLAIDLLKSHILPIQEDEIQKFEYFKYLIDLLRHCVDQSDHESTVFCYSYLSINHSIVITEYFEEGLYINLLSLANRHVLPDLSLSILSQMIRSHRTLELVHLLPSIGSLCRAGNRMREVIELTMRMNKWSMNDDEVDLLSHHLLVGHLGGLEQYRNLLRSTDIEQSEMMSSSNQSLQSSSLILSENLVHQPKSEQEENNQKMIKILVHSLIEAQIEMGQENKAFVTYQNYFMISNDDNDHHHHLLNFDGHTLILLEKIKQGLKKKKNDDDQDNDHDDHYRILEIIQEQISKYDSIQ